MGRPAAAEETSLAAPCEIVPSRATVDEDRHYSLAVAL